MEIIGRLTANAQVKTLKDKRQVVTFSIAINDYYTSHGEKKQDVTFFNCSYWLNVNAAPLLTKGSVVQLNGRVGLNAYKGMDGEFQAFLTFHVNGFKIAHKAKTSAVGVDLEPAAQKDDLPF